MISNETRKAYSEVILFLNLLNENDKAKIPIDLMEFFEKNMDKSYFKEINPEIDIKDQNLMEETLAIIAYNEPITRIQVDAIRGVSSSSIIRKLVAKGFVKESGRSNMPGRPILYETTTIIAMLNLKYWCDDEYEKIELIKKYKENDKKYDSATDDIRVADVIFTKKKEPLNKKHSTDVVEITPYKKDNFFHKLIKSIFKIWS